MLKHQRNTCCTLYIHCATAMHIVRSMYICGSNDAAFESWNEWEKSKTNAQQHIYETISFHFVVSHLAMYRKIFYWNCDFYGRNIQNSEVYALHTAHIVMKPTCDLSIKIRVAFFSFMNFSNKKNESKKRL